MSVIITITGPTCAGKSTLEQALVKTGQCVKLVSHTTRKPRPGEVNGVHYHFIEQDHFEAMQRVGAFINANVVHGFWYGTSERQVFMALQENKVPVLVCDPDGRDTVLQWAENEELPALPIFLSNPANVLATRFIERFVGDLALTGLKAPEMQEKMASYARRLDAMLSEETQWQMPHHANAILFGVFNAQSEGRVIGRILERVRTLG